MLYQLRSTILILKLAASSFIVSTSPQTPFVHLSKKTRNKSKLFYVVNKIMPQTELKPESLEAKPISESTTRFQPALYPLDLIPALPKLTQTETFFAVRYNYVEGPSLLASEIIFQPQSRGDDVTEEVTRSHGLSLQVNHITAALTFSSLFLRKEQADPSATRSSTQHILAIVSTMKRRAASNPKAFFRLFCQQVRHNRGFQTYVICQSIFA